MKNRVAYKKMCRDHLRMRQGEDRDTATMLGLHLGVSHLDRRLQKTTISLLRWIFRFVIFIHSIFIIFLFSFFYLMHFLLLEGFSHFTERNTGGGFQPVKDKVVLGIFRVKIFRANFCQALKFTRLPSNPHSKTLSFTQEFIKRLKIHTI